MLRNMHIHPIPCDALGRAETDLDAMDINYTSLPAHMQDAMRRYVEHGIQPGSFLTAVLSNDLIDAMRRADDVNLHALPAYGRFLINEAPCGCFGSPETFQAWCKSGGLTGVMAKAEAGDAA